MSGSSAPIDAGLRLRSWQKAPREPRDSWNSGVVCGAVSSYAKRMVETVPVRRFGAGQQSVKSANSSRKLVAAFDFATANHWRAITLLTLCALVFFLPGFFNIPPIDRDEARFAQATKQMVESGDFVDIRFQDDVRYKKPVGIYWLQRPCRRDRLGARPATGAVANLALPRAVADRRDRCGAADLLGGARLRHPARGCAGRADDVQLRSARRRGAARQDRRDAAAHRHRGDGGDGAGVSFLAARRGSGASAVVVARDFLDCTGRRHPAQGTADPDVRRTDDSGAGVLRPQRGLALAHAPGMGPDVAPGVGAAMVRCDLLARRRCILRRLPLAATC